MASKSVEEIKSNSRGLRGTIAETLQSDTTHFSEEDYQLLKFHGTYQQDDRDLRVERKRAGEEKAWIFMVRSKIPGGDLTAEQYLAHDRIAEELGNKTLRITTREGFQMHGVVKGGLKDCIAKINEAGLTTLGACGDVVRNTIAPSSPIADHAHQTAQALACELSRTFLPKTKGYPELWVNGEKVENSSGAEADRERIYGEYYLPRKFKIAIAIPPRNDVDVYTNDIGFLAHVQEGAIEGYTVVVGGGFGMTHGKTETFPALAKPLFYIRAEHALEAAIAIVCTQRDYGRRDDRKQARLKYLVASKGIEWVRKEVVARMKVPVEDPRPVEFNTVSDLFGWHEQGDGRLFCGIWVSEGRIKDDESHQYRSGFRKIAEEIGCPMRLTANCNVLFYNIQPDQKETLERLLKDYNIPHTDRFTEARRLSHACVALPTCGLALSESERVFPQFMDRVDEILRELKLENESILIRMSGCPNGCSRPYNSDIALVGRAPGKYALFVGGAPDGTRMSGLVQKTVPLDEIPGRIREILQDYVGHRKQGETFSQYWSRTQQPGEEPHSEQFHVELAARAERLKAQKEESQPVS